MASQYYFLPVEEGRYDQRWVFTPSRRCSSSTSSPTPPYNVSNSSASPIDEVFDALCQKVTAVHEDSDVDSDEDIEFETLKSPVHRTVSIGNSAVMEEDSTGQEDSNQGDRPQFLLLDEVPSSLNDIRIDHSLDQDLEIMNFEVDIMKNSSNVDNERFVSVDDRSRASPPSLAQSHIDTVTTEDGASEYEGDEASEQTTKKRRTAVKKGSTSKKSAGKSARKKKVVEKIDPTNQPPLRALSAYNFFFRDERERLLYNVSKVLDDEKCRKLLTEHWHRDRTQKRRHRKTHGKIPFTQLSKIVSSQWKKLTEDQKDFYRGVSAKDWARYQRELEEYKAKQEPKDDSIKSSKVASKMLEDEDIVKIQDDVSETSSTNDDTQEDTTGGFVEV